MSEAILPRTISWTNWSSESAAAFSLMILSIIFRMVFSWEVLILLRVSADTAMRSL